MTADQPSPGSLLRRDRIVIAGALAAVCAIAWLATAHQASMMAQMDHSSMVPSARPLPIELALLFFMWTTMMVAMMLPGINPMVTAFAAINRRRRERDAAYVATTVFVTGYVIAWSIFSVAATGIQVALTHLGLLSPTMQANSPGVTAALFLLTGVYQLSPLKEVCLTRCRSPMTFVLSEWRDGALGAVVMGAKHGIYCIGCCGVLMLLLFAVAVMDLRWVALLTALVSAEKLLPNPGLWRRLFGVGLIFTGLSLASRLLF
jgi:predicted metal-binding membrane protein